MLTNYKWVFKVSINRDKKKKKSNKLLLFFLCRGMKDDLCLPLSTQ